MTKQHRHLNKTTLFGLAAILLVFSTVGWQSATAVDEPEKTDSDGDSYFLEELAKDLYLTAEEIENLEMTPALQDDPLRAPGFLWHMAASLQKTLTDEQKTRMLSVLDRVPGRRLNMGIRPLRGEFGGAWMQGGRFGGAWMQGSRFGGAWMQGGRFGGAWMQGGRFGGAWMQGGRFSVGRTYGGRLGASWMQGGRFGDGWIQGGRLGGRMFRSADPLDLTNEQQSSIEAIHEVYTDQYRTLAEERRNGTITAEDFIEQMQALRVARHDEVNAVLTEEQRSRLDRGPDSFQARRDEVTNVMSEVLELTEEQLEGLESLRDSHLAEMQALREQFRGDNLDQDTLAEALTALQDQHDEALKNLLSADQYEIVQIHHALTLRGVDRQIQPAPRQRIQRNRAPQRTPRQGRMGRR